MEKLLKLASQHADQAEVWYLEETEDNLGFTDAKLDTANTSLSSGIALRVIKDGRVGLAHTRNLLDHKSLLDQALLSAGNGMPVDFQFPHTSSLPPLDNFSPAIEQIGKDALVEEGNRVLGYIKKRCQGQVDLRFNYAIERSGIMNSAGTALGQKSSAFMMMVHLVFPGTGSGLLGMKLGTGQCRLSESDLDRLIELFRISEIQIVPETGNLPVIFTEFSLHTLLSRFFVAASPENFYNKVSPLLHKLGERIFSEKLSIWQDPLDPELGNSCAFDGEGTPTRKLSFVQNGVFKAIPTDLNYASKLGLEPTGNGLRRAVEAQPSAQPVNVCIAPGEHSLEQMIAGIDRGIIVQGLMGGHSGNILNGDYSVGVSTGFYIENGVLKGRVKDCLLSGNIYDTLNRIAALESSCHNLGYYNVPAILFDPVKVTGK